MGPDETNGLDVLDLADIDDGLTRGLAAAGVESVDLLGFDACLMATYEVASVAARHADFMLASQELEPGHGWDYGALSILLENPGASPVDLGRSILDGFAAQAESAGTDEDITLSLLDLGRMGELQSALAGVTGPLIADPALAPLLGRSRQSVLGFGRNPDPDLDTNLTDLGGILDGLGSAPDVSAAAGAARASLDDLVVASVSGRATTAATGLSVYFPRTEEHFRQGYLFLQGVPHWPDLLNGYYQAGAAIPADEQPVFVDEADQPIEEALYFFDEDGLNMIGTFDEAAIGNVTGASIFYGVFDEELEAFVFIGEEPAEVSDDGSGLVAAIYDLTVLTITDG